MTPEPQIGSFIQYFSRIKDPRIDRTKRHQLMDILIIAIFAIICGVDGWMDIELFGQTNKDWLLYVFRLFLLGSLAGFLTGLASARLIHWIRVRTSISREYRALYGVRGVLIAYFLGQ
jgi:hypothetical protein